MSMFVKPDSVKIDDLEAKVEGLNELIDEQEEEIDALRARLAAAEAARDILWGRANRRGMAIEASYEALYGVMRGRNDVPRDVKDRLDAIARDLYASMDDPVDAALAGSADAPATGGDGGRV